MHGFFVLALHAHLPFVRHPEHEKFLEESWLFEAITECYLPLLSVLEGWERDRVPARLTLSMSPTLCAMLRDSLLQERYYRQLTGLIELSEKELIRTQWEPRFHPVAVMYQERFRAARNVYERWERDLVRAFGHFQTAGLLEIATCAATHALLPLLADEPASLRAQVMIARDDYRECFGCDPRGIWLPECAYTPAVEPVLQEANLRWFITDTHGVLHARPKPRYGVFAPVFTPAGIAVFGRDFESARQVWSRQEGYPGDPRYRDFYRDIGFDLEREYVRPYLPSPDHRGFTGIKYHRITGAGPDKEAYERTEALRAADEHAAHFLEARIEQITKVKAIIGDPPLVLAPYDAELFGHWWYEGPEFLDLFVRKAVYDQNVFALTTPEAYLRRFSTLQVVEPSSSTWGEEGYCKLWLNEKNAWIWPHLQIAQERMRALARQFPNAGGLTTRALQQAGRELLLAQASDWPFILRTGSSPEYARRRVSDHLLRFTTLWEQLQQDRVDADWLTGLEAADNLFPHLDVQYWR